MEVSSGLMAGSHNRNELVVIHCEVESATKPQELSGQICQICGDDVVLTVDGELFVACNECAFPSEELATSMNAEKETKSALNAKPDSSVLRVDDIPPEQHALVPSYGWGAGGGRRRVFESNEGQNGKKIVK